MSFKEVILKVEQAEIQLANLEFLLETAYKK